MDLLPLSYRARALDLYLDLQTPKSPPPYLMPLFRVKKKEGIDLPIEQNGLSQCEMCAFTPA
jgi:hypothetical protein